MKWIELAALFIAVALLAWWWRRTRRMVTPRDWSQATEDRRHWIHADHPWPRNQKARFKKRHPIQRTPGANGSQAVHALRRIAERRQREG